MCWWEGHGRLLHIGHSNTLSIYKMYSIIFEIVGAAFVLWNVISFGIFHRAPIPIFHFWENWFFEFLIPRLSVSQSWEKQTTESWTGSFCIKHVPPYTTKSTGPLLRVWHYSSVSLCIGVFLVLGDGLSYVFLLNERNLQTIQETNKQIRIFLSPIFDCPSLNLRVINVPPILNEGVNDYLLCSDRHTKMTIFKLRKSPWEKRGKNWINKMAAVNIESNFWKKLKNIEK